MKVYIALMLLLTAIRTTISQSCSTGIVRMLRTEQSGDEGDTTTINFILDCVLVDSDFTIGLTYSNKGTTSFDDYDNSTTSVNIPTGVFFFQTMIQLSSDTTVEEDEAFCIAINSVGRTSIGSDIVTLTTLAIEQSVTVMIINDDTATVSITPASFSHSEGDTDTTATVTLQWSTPLQDAGFTQVLNYMDGTALSLADYTAISSTVTLATSPATSIEVPITITGDTLIEGDEVFEVSLGMALAPAGYVNTDAITTDTTNVLSEVTIVDDDTLISTCLEGCGTGFCGDQNGRPGCICPEPFYGPTCNSTRASCRAFGDPHYITFDGYRYDFQGECSYIMITTAVPPTFTVSQRNQDVGNTGASTTLVIYIELNPGQPNVELIELNQGRVVTVDGNVVEPPFSGSRYNLVDAGGRVRFISDFGLEVEWNGISEVSYYLDARFNNSNGLLGGLCGNYNGVPGDDLGANLGIPVFDFASSLANRPLNPEICEGTEGTDPCGGTPQQAERICGIITSVEGPFNMCRQAAQAETQYFFESCVYDTCVALQDATFPIICDILSIVAKRCQRVGFNVNGWRASLDPIVSCVPQCPSGSTFSDCTSACPLTCRDVILDPTNTPTLTPSCTTRCQEGCECAAGLVWQGGICVPEAQCGCYDANTQQFHTPGRVYLRPDCEEECTCNPGGIIQCITAVSCHSEAECQLVGSAYECVCSPFVINGTVCPDTDECGLNLDNCSPLASCINNVGSFTCSCNAGYSGDGFTCVDDMPPTIINCPASSIIAYVEVGQMQREVSWTELTATDVSGGVTVSQTHSPGDNFQVGTTTVMYTFSDILSNMATCQFSVVVLADCTALRFNPSCDDTSCQCVRKEVCNSESGSCIRSCFVFECPADIESRSLSKVNPSLSVDISCTLTSSMAVLNRFDAKLSRNENKLDQDGIISLTNPNSNDGDEQTINRVNNVTGEEDLFCVLVRLQTLDLIVIGSVKVTGFVYELPSLGTAPTLITKSNTSITIRWNAWDSQIDIGDPPVVHYLPYYRMNSSDVWLRGPMEVLAEETLEFRTENLEIDTLYEFSVAAVREGQNGEGPRSPLMMVKTFCNVPQITADVTVLFTLSNEINISWLLPPGDVMCSTGVTKFTVYYKIEDSIDERLEMAGTIDDTIIRWFVIDGRSLLSATNYSFFVTFTTDQESLLSKKTEDSVLEVPLNSTAPVPEVPSAPLYLITLVVIPVLLIAILIVFSVVRYRRNTSFKDGKTTKADDGEDEDCVNAATADGPEYFIPLEKQSETISSSTYEDLNRKPQSSLSIPAQYEVTIVPEPQRPVAPPRIQTRNMKGINSSAYEDVGASSENIELSDVPQSDPSGDKDDENSYEVPDRLQEYTGVYVNIKNMNKLKQPEPIKVAEFQMFMSRTKKDVVGDIVHQFMSLPSGGQYPSSVAVKLQNKPRNFFKTILPYDHSRVKLDTAGSEARSDYINANYIKNHQGKSSFIAAQGPQKGTVDDFWKMVWQENVETIVMVTDTSEKNKSLCSTYWPNKVHMSEAFDGITVLLMESTSYTTHTIRKLNLFKGNPKPEVHLVTQVQVHSWPYGSVPKERTSLMYIVNEVKTWQTGGSCPMLVHCSNGVGASGTFIALYVLTDIIRRNKDISVFDFVAKMREDRVEMVQTKVQYLFIFEFLLTVLQSTDSEVSCDQLRKLGHDVIKLKSKEEFKVLQESAVKPQQIKNCIGYSPENQHKNRFTSIVPDDKFRPVLKSQGNSYGCNSYINAFHVADMGGREFIMTQTPVTSTVEDFWRLVYDYECTTIVMLNTINDSDETVVQYWPPGGSAHYGLMKVICTVTTKNDSFIHRQFEVANRKIAEKTICVDHFAFCGWSGNQPDVPKLKQFIIYTRTKGPGPVLTHCINGVGLSSVYIIVTTEIERLESRGAVDVCQSLQRLRKKCSFAIQSQEEYTLCYQILKYHLDNPEDYAEVY